jgi:hypothetical protein
MAPPGAIREDTDSDGGRHPHPAGPAGKAGAAR